MTNVHLENTSNEQRKHDFPRKKIIAEILNYNIGVKSLNTYYIGYV